MGKARSHVFIQQGLVERGGPGRPYSHPWQLVLAGWLPAHFSSSLALDVALEPYSIGQSTSRRSPELKDGVMGPTS